MKIARKEVSSESLECIQSRNVISFLDFDKSSNQYQGFKKHIDGCFFCRKKIAEFEKIKKFFNEQIPCIQTSKTIQESYENEIREIMKNLMRKYNEKKSFKIKKMTDLLASFLISKNMLIIYIVFTVLGFVAKEF